MTKISMIRAEMPAVERIVYLNAGTTGPLPRCTVEAIIRFAHAEVEQGRVGPAWSERMNAMLAETRGVVAELLGCSTDEVALTHNTTEGMNIALMGLDWKQGDELITAGSEHEGGLNPAAVLKARYGVNVIYSDIGLCNCDPIESLGRSLSPRTRAIVLSHVSWSTGAVLPLREICELAHRAGALVICDAAQACGMIPSRVVDIGVDAYAISGQKWLCGPDGLGALYVRRELLPQIQNTFAGYWGLKARVARADAEIRFGDTAQRYQVGAHYYPAVYGFGEGLKWIRDEVGWEWVYDRTRALGHYAYDSLAALPGVELYLPRDRVAGLIHFKVDGVAPADVTAQLYEQDIIIRHTPDPELNRAATGFYNSEQDIDRLCRAIRALR
jgi:L-cysteine/cystine lyase